MKRNLLVALLVLGVVLIVAAGVTYVVLSRQNAQPKPPDITLPPSLEDLAEEYPRLADIISNSELGSVYKEFLVKYEEEGEDAALDLARERGIVATAEGKEYVHLILVLDTDDHTEVVAEVERYGGKVFSAYKDQVSVGVPVEMVRQQLTTEDPGAIFEDMTGFEHVIAVRLPEPMIPDGSEIEGEGVGVIDADAWHAAGITGAGVKVAILDMGFDNYQELLGKELPDNVTFQHFGPDPDPNTPDSAKVHGTACAEIVHEIAPDAELILARYGGAVAWVEAHDWLIEQDVDIISHSAGWAVGPRDGTSWQAERVDELVSTHGILWVNAAGNDGLSHYRAEYNDADGDGLHDFESGANLMAIPNYGVVTIVLQWDDSWEAPTQDYQLHVFDANGNLLASSADEQSGQAGQYPVEFLRGSTGDQTVFVGVEAFSIDTSVHFDIYAPKARVEFPMPERSLGIPADARSSLSVGAANWDDDTLAAYSSQGPTDDGRFKPEISAPTKVQGASYGALGANFTGTSAACPHVSGASALVWQANPGYTRREVTDFLLANALDLPPDGPDTGYGYGRLQLPGEVGPSEPQPTPGPPTETPMPTEPGGPTPVPTKPNTPEPAPTDPAFIEPTPPPIEPGPAPGTIVVGVTVIVAGLGCGGMVLLLVGVIGLIVLSRRGRRAQPVPPPAPPGPAPSAPPPPPPPQPQMISCPHCGAAVRPGARFCPGCGQPVAAAGQSSQCPHCGAPMRAGRRFCPSCGRAVQ
jgi:subtilisin family serine protease